MPAGVGMGRYLTFLSASLFSMFLGAQTVHLYYRPLQDMDAYVAREKQKVLQENRSNS